MYICVYTYIYKPTAVVTNASSPLREELNIFNHLHYSNTLTMALGWFYHGLSETVGMCLLLKILLTPYNDHKTSTLCALPVKQDFVDHPGWRVQMSVKQDFVDQPGWRHQMSIKQDFVDHPGWRHQMEAFSALRLTSPLWGEHTGHRCISLTKASDAKLWCFLWCALG